jgi:hypothetical protein
LDSSYGFPEGVVIREIDLGSGKTPSAKRYLHFSESDVLSLQKAAPLPGSTLVVLMLTMHRSRVTQSGWVTLPQHSLDEWSVDRSAKSRAVAALSEAGLVEVDRVTGRSTRLRVRR